MDRLPGMLGRQLRRAGEAERFVRLIVGGGIALVAGLWAATLSGSWSVVWLFGVALVLLGLGGLTAGIWSEVDY